MTDLETLYRAYIDSLQDTIAHKIYLLESDKCFIEWVAQYHPDRFGEL